jgi:hypothetical protein
MTVRVQLSWCQYPSLASLRLGCQQPLPRRHDSAFIAYIGAVVLEPGTHYLRVFRVIGTAAVLTYAGGP